MAIPHLATLTVGHTAPFKGQRGREALGTTLRRGFPGLPGQEKRSEEEERGGARRGEEDEEGEENEEEDNEEDEEDEGEEQ